MVPDTSFENVDFIIKRSLRRESRQAWADLAKDAGEQRICRSGKSVWVGKTSVGVKGEKFPFAIVFEAFNLNSHSAIFMPLIQVIV